jgi:hypothetical protein
MSSTTLSTTIGVSAFLTDSNSSVIAALPRSISSAARCPVRLANVPGEFEEAL